MQRDDVSRQPTARLEFPNFRVVVGLDDYVQYSLLLTPPSHSPPSTRDEAKKKLVTSRQGGRRRCRTQRRYQVLTVRTVGLAKKITSVRFDWRASERASEQKADKPYRPGKDREIQHGIYREFSKSSEKFRVADCPRDMVYRYK
jgi:hypothetical protein